VYTHIINWLINQSLKKKKITDIAR
jgi:hypothetical protein